jgi:hypothetical protein
MSLASLSREPVRRASIRTTPPRGRPMAGDDDGAPPAPEEEGEAAPAAPSASNAFETLTRYIPTETITLYVGAMAARDEVARLGINAWGIYAIFALLTPALLAILTLSRARQLGQQGYGMIHWWPLAASAIAFLVWGASIPGHPVAEEWKALPALIALFISTVLTALDPILGPKPAAAL